MLATAAGAYIRIEGDNIELGAPGKVEFKGTQRDWTGAKAVKAAPPAFGQADVKMCELGARLADIKGAALVPVD